jgi:DNA-binding transcriptional regulator of glucitol operon
VSEPRERIWEEMQIRMDHWGYVIMGAHFTEYQTGDVRDYVMSEDGEIDTKIVCVGPATEAEFLEQLDFVGQSPRHKYKYFAKWVAE